MVMKCFVEAASGNIEAVYERTDLIPGTNKIRTYCANSSLYSQESDLEKITRSHHRVENANEKR